MSVGGYRLWLFAAIVVLAAALRLPALDVRPMHADEAVHAAKFARLLEQGLYQYDPEEFHGPTLNYLTLIPARVGGIARYADLDERTLRSVPAVIGILLVAAHILLVPIVGFASGGPRRPVRGRLTRDGLLQPVLHPGDAARRVQLRGARVDLPLSADAARRMGDRGGGLGRADGGDQGNVGDRVRGRWLARSSWRGRSSEGGRRPRRRRTAGGRGPRCHGRRSRPSPSTGVLFSSFFSHPRGIVDSVATYATWVTRAGGASWHIHPWHYYFSLLLYAGSDGSPIWTEAAILGLAIVGLVVAFTRSRGTGRHGHCWCFLAATRYCWPSPTHQFPTRRPGACSDSSTHSSCSPAWAALD